MLTLKNDEIVFFFDGHYYRDGSTAIICESSLAEPLLTIELQKFGQPSSAIEVKWLSGTDSEDNPSTISIGRFEKQGSFLGKKYMTNNIEASIEGDKVVYNLTIKLIADCSLDISKTRSKAAYGVDANTIEGYPTYNLDPKLNKPYKWIPKGGSDEVVLKLKPSNTSIKNHLDIHTPEANVSAEPILDPMGDLTQHTLNHLSDTGNDFDKVHICDHYAYNLVSDGLKTLEVDIYIVTESDDDYIDYCVTDPHYEADCATPLSKRHKCINPGSDGVLDLYLRQSLYKDPPLSKLNNPSIGPDPIYYSGTFASSLEINPVPTFIPSTPYFCNTKSKLVPSNTPVKPILSSSKKAEIINDLNQIYNQVGISVNVFFIEVEYSFDSNIDDDIISRREQSELHEFLIRTDPALANITKQFLRTTGWIVYGESDEGVAGRATSLGGSLNGNTFHINYSNNSRRTVSHEIGHAKYFLWHPDDPGFDIEGLLTKELGKTDHDNFMSKGGAHIDGNEAFTIRPYHWNYIHTKH